MAILKNLVVNGSSRFLNKAYFQDVQIGGTATLSSLSLSGTLTVSGATTLNGATTLKGATTINNTLNVTGATTLKSMRADNGIELYHNTPYIDFHFGNSTTDYTSRIIESSSGTLSINNNLSIASTISAPTGVIPTLNSTNVNVTNNLRANHYDLQTVAQLGGSFYVSPTVKFPNSGTTLAVAKSGTTLTLTITDSSITSTTMAGVIWTAGSGVKVSGTINGVVTGTMDGTVSSINTGSHTLTLSVSGENSGSVQASPSGSPYTASQFSDLSVMVYQRRDGSNDYRVGIWMNCYDVANSSSTIRIYGGSDANPNVMLGNLTSAGLGTVNNLTPTGWGLFAQNAFLHGKVVANGGLIGNWAIGTNGMYYNSDAPGSTSITMIPGGTTASSTSIGGSSGSKQWIFTGKNLFGIDTDGKLYASSAVISGDITANTGYIGGTSGWTITAQQISSDTFGSDDSMFLATKDLSGEIANRTASDWRFTVGPHFGVTNDGSVYADSGTIGGAVIDNGLLKVPAAQITGTLTADQIAAGAIHIGTSNLLKKSYVNISNSSTYNIASMDLVERDKPLDGETVTMQIKGLLASTKSCFGIYNSGGSVTITRIYPTDYDEDTGIYTKTFNWIVGSSNNTFVNIYALTSSQSGESSIEWVKLERGNQPSGWGLSADEIGGFTITNSTIYNGKFGASGSVYISTGYGSSTAIGGSSGTSTWAYTAGKNFGVTTAGGIYAASGKIGGWTLDASSLYTGTKTASSSIIISSANITRSINGISRTGLRLLVGSNFGVSNNGILYASSATISGTLTAGSNSQIGPWTVSDESIYKVSSDFGNTTSGAAYFGNNGLSIGGLVKIDARSGASTLISLGNSSSSSIDISSNGLIIKDKGTSMATFNSDGIEMRGSDGQILLDINTTGDAVTSSDSVGFGMTSPFESGVTYTFDLNNNNFDNFVGNLSITISVTNSSNTTTSQTYTCSPNEDYTATYSGLYATIHYYYQQKRISVTYNAVFGSGLTVSLDVSWNYTQYQHNYTFGTRSNYNTRGIGSMAIGKNLINRNDNALAIGRYNKDDNFLFAVGNGESDSIRSNAFMVDHYGYAKFAGPIEVGNPGQTKLNLDIDCGDLGDSFSIPANGHIDKTITFNKEFSATPRVVVTLQSGSTSATVGNICCSITSRSTTGAVVRIFNNSTSKFINGDWIAIGETVSS